MPCTYTGGGSLMSVMNDREHFANEREAKLVAQNKQLRKAADRSTRLLCALTKRIKRHWLKDALFRTELFNDKELQLWMKEHCKQDRARAKKKR